MKDFVESDEEESILRGYFCGADVFDTRSTLKKDGFLEIGTAVDECMHRVVPERL